MLLLLLSPAKTINAGAKVVAGAPKPTVPCFLSGAMRPVLHKARGLSQADIKASMGVSAPLAALNFERYRDWEALDELPAAAAFDGPAYKHLSAGGMSKEQISECQRKVRILSGLYGLLRPLDEIRPYRLEMGTKLPVGSKPTLAKYWQQHVSPALNEAFAAAPAGEPKVLVNTASKEYFDAVDVKALAEDVQLLTIKFPGPAVYAKQARGGICRYAVETKATTAEDLQGFKGQEGEWSFAGAEETPLFKGSDRTQVEYTFTRVGGGGSGGKKASGAKGGAKSGGKRKR